MEAITWWDDRIGITYNLTLFMLIAGSIEPHLFKSQAMAIHIGWEAIGDSSLLVLVGQQYL